MKRKPPPSAPSHTPAPVDIAEQSVAGEEDPGAALDLGLGGAAAVQGAADAQRRGAGNPGSVHAGGTPREEQRGERRDEDAPRSHDAPRDDAERRDADVPNEGDGARTSTPPRGPR